MAFERYYNELLNFISGRLGDRDAARDLVQEAYARVIATQATAVSVSTIYPARKPSAPIRQPRAFLYRTAKNLLTDHHRRSVRRDHEDVQNIEVPAPSADQPDRQLESRQLGMALLSAIEALPPRCREAFVLYKFDGMPQQEIARQMGISLNMVEKHIIHGMIVCKRCMDEL